MKTIKLKDYEVDIKDALTWGDKEQIQNEFKRGVKVKGNVGDAQKGDDLPIEFDASVDLEAKYRLLELAIVGIRKNENGEEVNFSREWVNNLSVDDGDKLYEAVDEISKASKKK